MCRCSTLLVFVQFLFDVALDVFDLVFHISDFGFHLFLHFVHDHFLQIDLEVLGKIRGRFAIAEKQSRPLSAYERERLNYLFSTRIEKYLDRLHGECWLNDPVIAQMINRQPFAGETPAPRC